MSMKIGTGARRGERLPGVRLGQGGVGRQERMWADGSRTTVIASSFPPAAR